MSILERLVYTGLWVVGIWYGLKVVMTVIAVYQHNKIMFGLPWLVWLTLDQVVEMGYSRFWCTFLLPMYYKKGYLEIRLALPTDASEFRKQWIERVGFEIDTVEFYEFKLTKRGGRLRDRLKWLWTLNPI